MAMGKYSPRQYHKLVPNPCMIVGDAHPASHVTPFPLPGPRRQAVYACAENADKWNSNFSGPSSNVGPRRPRRRRNGRSWPPKMRSAPPPISPRGARIDAPRGDMGGEARPA